MQSSIFNNLAIHLMDIFSLSLPLLEMFDFVGHLFGVIDFMVSITDLT